jgi:hypothetical protein
MSLALVSPRRIARRRAGSPSRPRRRRCRDRARPERRRILAMADIIAVPCGHSSAVPHHPVIGIAGGRRRIVEPICPLHLRRRNCDEQRPGEIAGADPDIFTASSPTIRRRVKASPSPADSRWPAMVVRRCGRSGDRECRAAGGDRPVVGEASPRGDDAEPVTATTGRAMIAHAILTRSVDGSTGPLPRRASPKCDAIASWPKGLSKPVRRSACG